LSFQYCFWLYCIACSTVNFCINIVLLRYVPVDDLVGIYTELYGPSSNVTRDVITACTMLLYLQRYCYMGSLYLHRYCNTGSLYLQRYCYMGFFYLQRYYNIGSLYLHRYCNTGSLYPQRYCNMGSLYLQRYCNTGSIYLQRYCNTGSLYLHCESKNKTPNSCP